MSLSDTDTTIVADLASAGQLITSLTSNLASLQALMGNVATTPADPVTPPHVDTIDTIHAVIMCNEQGGCIQKQHTDMTEWKANSLGGDKCPISQVGLDAMYGAGATVNPQLALSLFLC